MQNNNEDLYNINKIPASEEEKLEITPESQDSIVATRSNFSKKIQGEIVFNILPILDQLVDTVQKMYCDRLAKKGLDQTQISQMSDEFRTRLTEKLTENKDKTITQFQLQELVNNII